MSGKRKRRVNPLYTLAATIVSAIASIASSATKAVAVPLGCVAAILLVFTLMLLYETRRGRDGEQKRRKPPDLHPDRLAASLTPINSSTWTWHFAERPPMSRA